ncbi:MAG TPA: hypothetical protein VM008_01890 [Phycisphaerae bacterium]|nr:hypothetical protein [Phycisphaerae bacterium]
MDTVDFEGDLCTLPIADVALDLEHMRSPLLDSLSDQIAAGLDRYAPLRFYRSTSPNTAADDRVRVNWWKGSERPDLIRVGITVRVSGGQDDEGMCVTAIGNSEVLLSSPEGSSSASLEEIEVAEVLGAPPIAISPAPQGEGAPMDLQRFHELCSQLAAMVGDYFPSPSEKDAEIVVAIEGQVIRTNAISGLDTRELRDEVSGLLFKAERLTGCAYTNLYEERGKTPANQ